VLAYVDYIDWSIRQWYISSSHLVDTLTNRPEVKHGWGLHKEDVPQDDLLQAMKVSHPNEHQTPSSTITKLPNEPVELFRRANLVQSYDHLHESINPASLPPYIRHRQIPTTHMDCHGGCRGLWGCEHPGHHIPVPTSPQSL